MNDQQTTPLQMPSSQTFLPQSELTPSQPIPTATTVFGDSSSFTPKPKSKKWQMLAGVVGVAVVLLSSLIAGSMLMTPEQSTDTRSQASATSTVSLDLTALGEPSRNLAQGYGEYNLSISSDVNKATVQSFQLEILVPAAVAVPQTDPVLPQQSMLETASQKVAQLVNEQIAVQALSEIPSPIPSPSARPSTLPGTGACTAQYLPVCGVDNKTYSNSCIAGQAGVKIMYNGACGAPSVGPTASPAFSPRPTYYPTPIPSPYPTRIPSPSLKPSSSPVPSPLPSPSVPPTVLFEQAGIVVSTLMPSTEVKFLPTELQQTPNGYLLKVSGTFNTVSPTTQVAATASPLPPLIKNINLAVIRVPFTELSVNYPTKVVSKSVKGTLNSVPGVSVELLAAPPTPVVSASPVGTMLPTPMPSPSLRPSSSPYPTMMPSPSLSPSGSPRPSASPMLIKVSSRPVSSPTIGGCTAEYRPVCGANGRTYPNECEIRRAGVTIAKLGVCGSPTPSATPSGTPKPSPTVYRGQQGVTTWPTRFTNWWSTTFRRSPSTR